MKIIHVSRGYLAIKPDNSKTQNGLSSVVENYNDAFEYALVEIVRSKTLYNNNGKLVDAKTIINNLIEQNRLEHI